MRVLARLVVALALVSLGLAVPHAARADGPAEPAAPPEPTENAHPCEWLPNAIVADLGLHVVNAGYQRTVGCHLVLQGSMGLYVAWTVNDDILGLGGGDRPPPGIWDAAGFVVRVRSFIFPTGGLEEGRDPETGPHDRPQRGVRVLS